MNDIKLDHICELCTQWMNEFQYDIEDIQKVYQQGD